MELSAVLSLYWAIRDSPLLFNVLLSEEIIFELAVYAKLWDNKDF